MNPIPARLVRLASPAGLAAALAILAALVPAIPAAARDWGDIDPPWQPGLYASAPDTDACAPGELSSAARRRVLDLLNRIRRAHGLGPVLYDPADEPDAMRAALVIAASGRMSHFPPQTEPCWSPGAALGARSSNIALREARFSPRLFPELVARASDVEADLIGWLTDVDNVTADGIGHRRWLLDPFLRKVAYGHVVARPARDRLLVGTALRVIGTRQWPGTSTETVVETVAYPFHDYPADWYAPGAWLSLSILADRGDAAASRAVDFGAARVRMALRDGTPVAVRDVRSDNLGAGLPNSLQFRGDDLLPGRQYHVTVSGVRVNGQPREYAWWFRLER